MRKNNVVSKGKTWRVGMKGQSWWMMMMMKMADEVTKEVMNLDNMFICVCHNVIIHGLSARKAGNTVRVRPWRALILVHKSQ